MLTAFPILMKRLKGPGEIADVLPAPFDRAVFQQILDPQANVEA
jgi:hypothetical protein